MTTPRPVTGPDGDNPITDEQIRDLRDEVRAEIERLIGIKNNCLDGLDVGASPQRAAARARCAAAYNARLGKE